MNKETHCPHCPAAVKTTDTTCPSCGEPIQPQAAHGCCEEDEMERDNIIEKIVWALLFAVIGGVIVALAKGEI